MSKKKENIVCRASYCKVFSGIFRRVSFSAATPVFTNQACYFRHRLFGILERRRANASIHFD
jgi:hypothetical protein